MSARMCLLVMDVNTAHDVLGVPKGSDGQLIRRKYFEFSLQNHPDKGGDVERFVLANVAYNVLMEHWKELVIQRLHGKKMRTFNAIATTGMICVGYKGLIDAVYYEKCEVCLGVCASSVTDVVTCMSCCMENPLCKSCRGRGMFVKQGKECVTCSGTGTQMKRKHITVAFPAGVSDGQHVGFWEGKDVRVAYANGRKRGNDVVLEIDVSIGECMCGFSRTIDTFHGSKVIGSKNNVTSQKLKIKGHGILGIGDFIVLLNVRIDESDVETIEKYREVFERIFKQRPLLVDQCIDVEF